MLLVLFDIDGTLLLSSGQGAKAMQEAGRRVLGPSFSLKDVAFAGRLDPLIFRDGLELSGFDDGHQRHHETFRTLYTESLRRRLAEPGLAQALPGVAGFVRALRNRKDMTLGILTGNYPETGRTKLSAAGLDPSWFPVSIWGIDGASRRDLPRMALRRYEAHAGEPIAPDRVVIIGDTPHDIDCAHHNGCLAIAVASGPSFDRRDLEAHDPDLLVDDLEDTAFLVSWLEARGRPQRPSPKGTKSA